MSIFGKLFQPKEAPKPAADSTDGRRYGELRAADHAQGAGIDHGQETLDLMPTDDRVARQEEGMINLTPRSETGGSMSGKFSLAPESADVPEFGHKTPPGKSVASPETTLTLEPMTDAPATGQDGATNINFAPQSPRGPDLDQEGNVVYKKS